MEIYFMKEILKMIQLKEKEETIMKMEIKDVKEILKMAIVKEKE